MNLIEQLGGYEKAKKLVDACKRYGRSDVEVPVNGGFIHIVADFLELDLLEYRRQQNIFEIGDLYVFTEKYSKHSVIHKVDSLNSGKGCIRHATPEEIKAGRRL